MQENGFIPKHETGCIIHPMHPEYRRIWLEERRKGLGSSDIAAICGHSPWATPLHVYLDKLGQLPHEDSAPKAWGQKLEDTVAMAYQETTGRKVTRPPYAIQRHAQYPWMLASLDRITETDQGEPAVLELKTTAMDHGEWGEPGTDEVPIGYLLQVQHQLAVTGWVHAEIAVLVAGHDFRIYSIPRNDELIGKLIRIEAAFWKHVQDRIEPAPTWDHPETLTLMESRYSLDPELRVELPEEALYLQGAYQKAKENEKEAKSIAELARGRLLKLMGDAAVGVLPNGQELFRIARTRKGYSVEETSYTEFRILPRKKGPSE